jgi:hypothetical protein
VLVFELQPIPGGVRKFLLVSNGFFWPWILGSGKVDCAYPINPKQIKIRVAGIYFMAVDLNYSQYTKI